MHRVWFGCLSRLVWIHYCFFVSDCVCSVNTWSLGAGLTTVCCSSLLSTASHWLWSDLTFHLTALWVCTLCWLSLLVSTHTSMTVSHWLWSDLTFLPTELWPCAVCQPCLLILYPYIHDCITLVTWHSSPQNCEHVLCVNLVSSYIHTSMTVSHWWPGIPPHRTVSMYCVSTLSLLISIHHWLYRTGCGAT